MSNEVRDLAIVSLNRPIKVFVDNNRDVAFNLRQEFIRVRPNHEGIKLEIWNIYILRN